MRILKIVGLSALALLLIFLSLGWMSPSVDITDSVEVPIPVQQAYDAYKDISLAGKWMDKVESITLIRGTEGQPGAVYKLRILEDGTSYDMEYSLLRDDPGRHLVYRLENDVLVNDIELVFGMRQKQTQVARMEKIAGKTAFMKSALLLMRTTLQQHTDAELKRFAEVASGK